ncbi:hypothetical protein COU59_03735 [Candidatus Pacearchaeota archaeon CG10_big_fil_rev_8_21_14_0_10_34_12]|nr:MAG: hypothetical protein COU59_03735 [Candidatus Pacearchaeota archaeon CG10_big_fil_rev_8_21_14_0_10_34_12]
MAEGDYEKLIAKISKSSGLNEEEVRQKIIQKQEKISGMISKEGAAQIVAAELGVNLEGEKSKINEIFSGMRRVNTIGKVINLFPIRTFIRNEQESKVANMIIADDTSNIKVVLWDMNHIGLIESGKIEEGCIIEISNGNLRGEEIHLGNFSELKISTEVLENVKTEKIFRERKISELGVMDNVRTRAFVVQIFEPKFFYICPQCRKKAVPDAEGYTCEKHGKIVPEKRALINLVLDDGTGTIRTVIFHENLNNLGISPEEEFLEQKKQEILGKEMFFSGNVRMNKFFNSPELIVEEVNEVNVEELVNHLENGR